jgi:hypothetical protein
LPIIGLLLVSKGMPRQRTGGVPVPPIVLKIRRAAAATLRGSC